MNASEDRPTEERGASVPETDDASGDLSLLLEIAQATSLREGGEGVRNALWELHWLEPRSTREWARSVRLPVPVLAAIRGELQSRGLLDPNPHPTPTEKGRSLLDRLFGTAKIADPACPLCRGRALLLPPELTPLIEYLAPVLEERPQSNPALDQSHALPETGLLRASFLAARNLLREDVLFLGDDDLSSVALALLLSERMPDRIESTRITVVDIDERYLSLIREAFDDLDIPVETHVYDVREPLPSPLKDRFTAAVTDPPYTPDGITLFAWRCAEALLPDGGDLLLAYAPPDPLAQHVIQGNLHAEGWIQSGVYRDAAEYIGASVHAHRSDLYHLTHPGHGIGSAPEIVDSVCYSTLYTGELGEPGGVYRCARCGAETAVGPGKVHITVADLKREGCPECGAARFQRYGQNAKS